MYLGGEECVLEDRAGNRLLHEPAVLDLEDLEQHLAQVRAALSASLRVGAR